MFRKKIEAKKKQLQVLFVGGKSRDEIRKLKQCREKIDELHLREEIM